MSFPVRHFSQAPDWIIDKLREKPKPEFKSNGGSHHHAGNRETAYAQAALDNTADDLARERSGNRNNLLNISALKMGSMVARGWIDRITVADARGAGRGRRRERVGPAGRTAPCRPVWRHEHRQIDAGQPAAGAAGGGDGCARPLQSASRGLSARQVGRGLAAPGRRAF